jgi:hypothetical protein
MKSPAPGGSGVLDLGRESDRVLRVRAALCEKYPAEFHHGYATGYVGDPQPPCDAAGYQPGFRTWPLDRRNAWFAGWNLGNVERQNGQTS